MGLSEKEFNDLKKEFEARYPDTYKDNNSPTVLFLAHQGKLEYGKKLAWAKEKKE